MTSPTNPRLSRTAAATSPDVRWTVVESDCLDLLADIDEASIDAIVTDPPYGIGFQGARWDGPAIRQAAALGRGASAGDVFQVWCNTWAAACLRVLRPGGHLAAFGSPRTAHRLACGLEQAGFELRDTLLWLYGTGMPKSRRLPGGRATQLKPAYEPILLVRRPPDGPIERNLQVHGTGALNADGCRVEDRFPANVIVSHADTCRPSECADACAVRLVDEAADRVRGRASTPASRLFYCPKASRRERNAGCTGLPPRRLDLFPNSRHGQRPATNPHPTVKPLALMRWLVRLVAPPGGLCLDPFCGSGSTGCAAVLEQRRFLGIELNPDYGEIARARIAHWTNAESQDAASRRSRGSTRRSGDSRRRRP